MVKVGKKEPAPDPFQQGNKAFEGIASALSGLDGAEATQAEPVPEEARELPTSVQPAGQPAPPLTPPERPLRAESGGEALAQAPKGAGKKQKRFWATADERARFDRASMNLSARLGTKIDFSKLTRALWEVYLHHEEDILRNVPADADWALPSTSDQVRLAELDQQLVELLNGGLMVASRRPGSAR